MIGFPQFVLGLRERLDKELVEYERTLVGGHALDTESVGATALKYAEFSGFLRGLRQARETLDDLVKQVNSGDL